MIPLGKAVGIKLFADGALVVSLEGSDTLKVGDLLLKVNDTRVQSTEQLQALLQKMAACRYPCRCGGENGS